MNRLKPVLKPNNDVKALCDTKLAYFNFIKKIE